MRFLSTLLASLLGTLLAFGLLAFIGLLFFAALLAASDPAPGVTSGSVLVVEVDGALPEFASDDPFAGAFGGSAGYDLRDLQRGLRMAAADDRIDALWIKLTGVSAGWAVLEEARAAIAAFRESGKPVYASSEGLPIDEAEYFLASAADSIFVPAEAPFEFNGFYLSAEFYQGLLEKLDIDPQVVRAGRFKSAVEPYTRSDLSAENEEQLRMLLDARNARFMETVAEARGLTVDGLQALAAENALFTASGALEAGLVDALLFDDEVADVIRHRLGLEEDEELNEVDLSDYKRVPASAAGIEEGNEGEIAVVYAVGAIMSGESGYSANPLLSGEMVGDETFAEAMREARTRDRVKAVVVRIDSPGGYAPAADAMWHEMRRTAAEKPVLVSMGNLAASGGYWMAVAADTIVADPLTITGSIGVFSVFFDLGGFFENKLGITYDGVQTSPYADMFSTLRPLSEAERRLLERSTNETYERFLSRVAEGRGLDVLRVDSVGQGRVWTGMEALENGLVDVLGGLETAVELAAERAGLAEGTYRTYRLPRPKTFPERVADALETRAASAWLDLRTTPAERLLLEQARLLSRLVETHGTVQARLPFELVDAAN